MEMFAYLMRMPHLNLTIGELQSVSQLSQDCSVLILAIGVYLFQLLALRLRQWGELSGRNLTSL